jgi:hypothetical protein
MPRDLIQIRCTSAEKLAWEKLAADSNMSLADYVRSRVGRPMRKSTPVHDPALIRSLAAIGNNLNQVARVLNAGREFDLESLAILVSIERAMHQLVQAVKNGLD